MKVRAPNIRPFAAKGHFSLYYRPFFSLSSYEKLFQIYGRLKNIRGYKVYFEFSGCNFLQENAVPFLGALVTTQV